MKKLIPFEKNNYINFSEKFFLMHQENNFNKRLSWFDNSTEKIACSVKKQIILKVTVL